MGSLGHFLTPDEAKFAYMATDGWAIGVNAVALSGQLREGGGYDFGHYFEDQAWSNWDEAVRTFCMRTCIVDEFDTELAKALSGRDDASTVMDSLSKSNSFLSHQYGDTYRYHHLFREFLREKLETSGIDTSALNKTAAQYYKDHGDTFRALRYWLDSGDYKGTNSYLFLFLFRGQNSGVADYADFLRTFFTDELSAKAFREAPVLHVLYAWYYYLTSRYEEYASHMDAILKNLPRIAKAGNEFLEFAMLAFHVDYRKSLQSQVRAYHIFGGFLKKHAPEGLATNIASFTHNLPYLHRSNRDYSEIALDFGILDKINNTFAPLLGLEWTYIRPGLNASFAYERNQLKDALTLNDNVLRRITEENKVNGRICVMVLRHSILWQLGRKQEADVAMDDLSALTESCAQYFIPNLNAYRTS